MCIDTDEVEIGTEDVAVLLAIGEEGFFEERKERMNQLNGMVVDVMKVVVSDDQMFDIAELDVLVYRRNSIEVSVCWYSILF